MTKDLVRDALIARAFVILITNPDNDLSDPNIRSGFESLINAIGEEVEKASQPEGTQQVEQLEAMRDHASDVFEEIGEGRTIAMERLAEDFETFTETIPGFDSNISQPAMMPSAH